ncbi:hypothetical protein [Brevundimonas sp.]|uniref:hypothetical protein n=1 Tax=Brevundimonas sp. TaxID=1871086 RepID=UPI0028A23708|nr:hypothetical protein [Brevundimonas sp.]
MSNRLTILGVTVAVQKGEAVEHTHVAAAFDAVRSQDTARSVGRQIGQQLGDMLALHLQQGKDLAA